MSHSHRYGEAKKITLLGALVNALLGVVKLIGGLLYHSHALVADGIHSFSDLITDAMVLFASKYGSQDADASHPYGHQRIETAATFLLALLLILAGLGIAWDAVDELINGSHTKPGWIALPIALISIVANELLFYYTRHIGQRIQSPLIIANAWHHRSDAAASVVVSLGLIGSLLGWIYLDAVAAVIVGLLIVKMGLSYGWNSIKELVDTAVSADELIAINAIIQSIDGVQKVHQLRSRMMGGDIYLDVHIMVNPWISVSEGHYIAQHVHYALTSKVDAIKDVTVHVDPEDDENSCPSVHLPGRAMLEKLFIQKWQSQFPAIETSTIHYLDGKLSIDLISDDNFKDIILLKEHITRDLSDQFELQAIRLLRETILIHHKTS